ncbi:alpha/beta hydrolase [Flavobacterium sp. SH_e]|uniref:alpha/beta fold hydrolase n=1 Tax=Flavobacterium TaxID=237 RepID=UPI0021E4F56E|nr:alpha/beta hydrolase [Flavobacterium sp. SH_e]MCV2484779.1 alpha/beta hydrolase [Flavobacterium sp. SH_e]
MTNKSITEQACAVAYKSIYVNDTEIFYREAGEEGKPNLLLLHGYPSSSHMFRNVIPMLSEQFHILAPDLPGFGFSAVPEKDKFAYTFENFALIIAGFLEKLNITKTSFYLFDYGAPILMHVIAKSSIAVEMLIFQNGNIYEEGLGQGIKNSMFLFDNENSENSAKLEKLVEFDYIKWEYLTGVSNLNKIAPESYHLDQFLMQRIGLREIHLAIKKDYGNNLAFYKAWQEKLIASQFPTLIVWGENDEVFLKEGAIAIHNALPSSKLIFYPTGHFALEEFGVEIAGAIIDYYYNSLQQH